jgi:serpin B
MRKALPLLFLLACNETPPAKEPPLPSVPDAGAVQQPTVDAEAPPPVQDAGPVTQQPDKGNGDHAFAASLYSKLREKDGNLFLSPASIRIAMGMTYAGAKGDTAKEMEQALKLDADPHASFAAILKDWNGRNEKDKVTLRVVNKLWGQKGRPFLPAFLSQLETQYGAPLEQVDFKAAPDPRVKINAWVEKQTENKIKELLPPGSINADTRMVLTNAIYFKSNWTQAFNAGATKDGDFTTPKGNVKAKMMSQQARFGYAEVPGAKLLEMHYTGSGLSMLVVLPDAKDGLQKVEQAYDGGSLKTWVEALQPIKVNVTFPRFETSSKVALKETLVSMGMPTAFQEGKADFSGMDGTKELSISNVFHQGWVKVDEKGTEAAAATGTVMTVTSADISQPKDFKADHPFLFFIRDTKNGHVLFMGRIQDPNAK